MQNNDKKVETEMSLMNENQQNQIEEDKRQIPNQEEIPIKPESDKNKENKNKDKDNIKIEYEPEVKIRKYKEKEESENKCDSILSFLMLIFFICMIFSQFPMSNYYKAEKVLDKFFGLEDNYKYEKVEDKHNSINHMQCMLKKLLSPFDKSYEQDLDCYKQYNMSDVFAYYNPKTQKLTIEDEAFEVISTIRVTSRFVKTTQDVDKRKDATSISFSDEELPSVWRYQEGIKTYEEFSYNKENYSVPVGDLYYDKYGTVNTFLEKGGLYWIYNYKNNESNSHIKDLSSLLSVANNSDNFGALTLDLVLYQPENKFYVTVIISNQVNDIGGNEMYHRYYYVDDTIYNTGWGYFQVVSEYAFYIFMIIYIFHYFTIGLSVGYHPPSPLDKDYKRKISRYNSKNGRLRSYYCCETCWDKLIGNIFSFCQFFGFIFCVANMVIHIIITIIKVLYFKDYEDSVDSLLTSNYSKIMDNQNKFISLSRLNELYRNLLIISIILICTILIKILSRVSTMTKIYFDTISQSIAEIISFALITCVILFACTSFTWLYYGSHLIEYQNYKNAIQQNFEFIFGYLNCTLVADMYNYSPVMTVIYYLIQTLIIRFILLKMFLGIILYYFSYTSKSSDFIEKQKIENETLITKFLVGYATFINFLCQFFCCCCTAKITERIVENKKGELIKLRLTLNSFENTFEQWKIENIECPDIAKHRQSLIQKENKHKYNINTKKVTKLSKYVGLEFDENYVYEKKNMLFQSENDKLKNRIYYERQYHSIYFKSVFYFLFIIVFLIAYVLNIRTPWKMKTFSQMGDKFLNITEINSMADFKNFKNIFLGDIFYNKSISEQSDIKSNFTFLDKSIVFADSIFFTARLMKLNEENQRKDEEIRIHNIHYEDKSPINELNLLWEKEHTYNKLGGFFQIINLNDIDKYFGKKALNLLVNEKTAYINLESFSLNKDYEIVIYSSFEIKRDHSNFYIVKYNTNFLKYSLYNEAIDITKIVFDIIFCIFFIYLVIEFFVDLVSRIRLYNRWYNEVIEPINLNAKSQRIHKEPELLKEFLTIFLNFTVLTQIIVLGLSIGAIYTTSVLWVKENELKSKKQEYNNANIINYLFSLDYEISMYSNINYNSKIDESNYKYLFKLRNIVYEGINAKNNLQILGIIIIVFAVLRLFSLFTLGNALSILNKTLAKIRPGVIALIISFIFLFPSFVLYCYIAFGSKSENFSTIGQSILSCLKCLFGYVKHEELYSYHTAYGPLFLFIYIFVCQTIFINLFISLIYLSYSIVKPMVKEIVILRLRYCNIVCCCSKNKVKKDQKMLLFSELEYSKKVSRFISHMIIDEENIELKEFLKNEGNQIKCLNDSLNYLTKKKEEISLGYTNRKYESIFDDCSYSDINEETYYAYKTQYLNNILLINETLQDEIVRLYYGTDLLNKFKKCTNIENMILSEKEKSDKLDKKIEELDKKISAIKSDSNILQENINYEKNNL